MPDPHSFSSRDPHTGKPPDPSKPLPSKNQAQRLKKNNKKLSFTNLINCKNRKILNSISMENVRMQQREHINQKNQKKRKLNKSTINHCLESEHRKRVNRKKAQWQVLKLIKLQNIVLMQKFMIFLLSSFFLILIQANNISTTIKNTSPSAHLITNKSSSEEILIKSSPVNEVIKPVLTTARSLVNDQNNKDAAYSDYESDLPLCEDLNGNNPSPNPHNHLLESKDPPFILETLHESRDFCLSMVDAWKCQTLIDDYDYHIGQILNSTDKESWNDLVTCRPFWHYGACWQGSLYNGDEMISTLYFDDNGTKLNTTEIEELKSSGEEAINNHPGFIEVLTIRIKQDLPHMAKEDCIKGHIERDCRVIKSQKFKIIHTTWDVNSHEKCEKKRIQDTCFSIDANSESEIELEKVTETTSEPINQVNKLKLEPSTTKAPCRQPDTMYNMYDDYQEDDDYITEIRESGVFSEEHLAYMLHGEGDDVDCGIDWDRATNKLILDVGHEELKINFTNGKYDIALTHCGPQTRLKDVTSTTQSPNVSTTTANPDLSIDGVSSLPQKDTNKSCGNETDIILRPIAAETIRNYDYILRVLQTIMTSSALLLLLCLRKLHCTRNIIHMNLLLSFVIRSVFQTMYESYNPENMLIEKDKLNEKFNNIYPYESGDDTAIIKVLQQLDKKFPNHSYAENYVKHHSQLINNILAVGWGHVFVEEEISLHDWRKQKGDTPGKGNISNYLYDHCYNLNHYQTSYLPCKLISICLQYAITANYFWLLVGRFGKYFVT